MTPVDTQHTFPLVKTLVYLSAMSIACFASLIGLLGWVFNNPPAVSETVGLAVAVVWAASVLGVLPMGVLGPRGVMPTVCGYFFGTGLRLVICFGLFLFVRSKDLFPIEPMAVALVLTYLPLLFIETAVVGRYLWNKDSRPGGNLLVKQQSVTDGLGVAI